MESVRELRDKFLTTEGLSKSVYRLYEAHGKGFDFLKWAIDDGIKDMPSFGDLFRGENFVTRIFSTQFSEDVGKKYLQFVCLPLLEAVIKGDRCLEIESTRASEGTDVKENLGWFFEQLKEFVDRLPASVDMCPIVVREGFSYLNDALKAKEVKNRETMLVGYLFLRFITPAIVQPGKYGILEDGTALTAQELSAEANRGLVIASRLLQHVANGLALEAAHEHSGEISDFVASHHEVLKGFFTALVDPKGISAVQGILKTHSRSATFSSIASERKEAIEDLKRVIAFNSGNTHALEDVVLTRKEINKIQKSWDRVQGKIDRLGVLFYGRLFETTPSTKKLFEHVSMERQASKLLGIVGHLIKTADLATDSVTKDKKEEMVKSLWSLGGRHIDYGVQSDLLFHSLAKALIWAMGHHDILGDQFDEYSATWTKAFRLAIAVMSKGMEDAEKHREFSYAKVSKVNCIIL